MSAKLDQPSIDALTYQTHEVCEALRAIGRREYPIEAKRIANLLLAICDHIHDELSGFRTSHAAGTLKGSEVVRALALSKTARDLYSYVRYLRSSKPRQTPPSIQLALEHLLRSAATPDLRAACLVRPKWKYNLTYTPMTIVLSDSVKSLHFDPLGALGTSYEEIIGSLWRRARTRYAKLAHDAWDEEPPLHVAVLSFAGVDGDDTLLFPLLAHELGHFLDYSRADRLSTSIANNHIIPRADVVNVLKMPNGTPPSDKVVDLQWGHISQMVESAIREFLADLVAVRLLGFSFFVAQAELLKTFIADWTQERLIENVGYPGLAWRLSVSLDELLALGGPEPLAERLRKSTSPDGVRIAEYLEKWRTTLADASKNIRKASPLTELGADALAKALPEIRKAAISIIPDDRCARMSDSIFDKVNRLKLRLPPIGDNETSEGAFADVMSAAWAYQILYGDDAEAAVDVSKAREAYRVTCRLTLKAVELLSPLSALQPGQGAQPVLTDVKQQGGSTLSAGEIRRRLSLSISDAEKLFIVPTDGSAVQAASVDVRLGNWFAVTRKIRIDRIDLSDDESRALFTDVARDEFYVQNDDEFVIHPGDFALAVTREFVALPGDLMAFVEGKSSIGRTGLLIATATQVAPGFHGGIVLELANTGTVPFVLRPGMPIAQLVFQKLTDSVPTDDLYRGRFFCQIRP